ncbi:hypothetical protein [Sorangium sp. So ce131]|uniref:hypothetical protein n=1 Tax=Sorangium sp. So ce131 TaxID=3133282 RepID=UPI003F5EE90C
MMDPERDEDLVLTPEVRAIVARKGRGTLAATVILAVVLAALAAAAGATALAPLFG